jgi:hypothetical protein
MTHLPIQKELHHILGHVGYNELMVVNEHAQKTTHDQVIKTAETRFEKRVIAAKNELIVRMDTKFEKVDARFEKVDAKFEKLNQKIDANLKWMVALWLTQMLAFFTLFYKK